MTLEKGTTLAGYRITGILGQGGMGVVYEATQISLNRTVALKVLAPHLSGDLLFRERFRREGQIQAGIDHEHIVTVHEAGESEHGFFIAMRLIRGPNLKDMIVSRELDPGRTLRILSPIGDALDTAHRAGLIHRDVKPQNILVGGRDQAFLADFGLTKGTGEQSLTRTGQFVGTFDYISPEQIMGERATTKSDVYALAAVLYECFTGVVPYPKEGEAAVLYAHMADPPPRITDLRPELPVTLDEVIATGMAKDPAERHVSGGELLLAVNRSFTRRMRAAFTPPGPIETPEELGIRPPELEVSTREAAAPDELPTEPGALEADTVSPTSAGITAPTPPLEATKGAVPAAAIPSETVEETAPDETLAGQAPAAEATAAPADIPEETLAGAAADDEEAPADKQAAEESGETPITALLPKPERTKVTPADEAPTRPGPPAEAEPIVAATAAQSREAARASATSRAPTPARRAGAPVLIAAAVGVFVILALAGFLLGSSGGSEEEEPAPAATNLQTAGALELTYPDGWRRPADPPTIQGLRLRDQISLSERGRQRGDFLLAGMSDATGPALLPAAFLDRLPEAPPRDDAVRSGELEAYRYRGLQPEGESGGLTLYVSPTTEGVATVACASATPAAEFLRSCEEVAGGLKLIKGERFPLGADEDYLAKLDKAIDRLNADRKQDVKQLRDAKKRAGQSKAAEALAKDYRRARSSLRGLTVSPAVRGASSAVQGALAKTEAAYQRLASAASRDREKAYDAARKDVQEGEAALKRALTRVEQAS